MPHDRPQGTYFVLFDTSRIRLSAEELQIHNEPRDWSICRLMTASVGCVCGPIRSGQDLCDMANAVWSDSLRDPAPQRGGHPALSVLQRRPHPAGRQFCTFLLLQD